MIKSSDYIVSLRSLTFSFGLCIGIISFFGCTDKEKTELALLQSYNSVSNFTAHNSNGATFNSKELKGKYWVINYFFASCEEICPKVNESVAKLNAKYSNKEGIEFVSVTVDPENDNDKVLNDYKKRFNGTDNWIFIRMPIDSLIKVSTKSFGVGHLSEPSLHSTRIILVDKEGTIRGYFDGLDTTEVKRLDSHLEKLLN